jgi:quinol monooxygenase YgiN
MVVGTIRLQPPQSRRREVLEILRCVQGPVMAMPGCEGFYIYEEQGPEPAVVLVEQWESPGALESHVRSDAYLSILGALELSSCAPEIRFDHVSKSEGMELIERVRQSPGGQWPD